MQPVFYKYLRDELLLPRELIKAIEDECYEEATYHGVEIWKTWNIVVTTRSEGYKINDPHRLFGPAVIAYTVSVETKYHNSIVTYTRRGLQVRHKYMLYGKEIRDILYYDTYPDYFVDSPVCYQVDVCKHKQTLLCNHVILWYKQFSHALSDSTNDIPQM